MTHKAKEMRNRDTHSTQFIYDLTRPSRKGERMEIGNICKPMKHLKGGSNDSNERASKRTHK